MSLGSITVELLRKPYHLAKRRLVSEIVSAGKLRAAKKRLCSASSLSDGEKSLLDRVSCRIHPDDCPYAISTPDEYLTAGISAVRCIDHVLPETKRVGVRSILDFACGFGRVLRFIRVRFPEADIIASDIDGNALEFLGAVSL